MQCAYSTRRRHFGIDLGYWSGVGSSVPSARTFPESPNELLTELPLSPTIPVADRDPAAPPAAVRLTAGQRRRGAWLALLAAFLGWMFDGMEMGIFPLVARPALQEMQAASGVGKEE